MKTVNLSFRASFFARRLALSLGLVTALAVPTTSRAASATWTGTADAIWSNVNDWTASPVPGVADTATFSNAGNGNTTIDLSSGVTIGNIVFDTSSAAAYTIGIGALGSETLTLQSNGIVTVNSTVSNPQLVNAGLTLGTNAPAGRYFLANNSGQSLTIAGGITGGTGGAAGAKNLFVGGSGSTTITNTLANGGGTLTLTKVGSGTLNLSGIDNGTGSIIVSNGTLNLTGKYQVSGSTANNIGLGVGAPNGTPIGVINVLPGAVVSLTDVNNENLFVANYPNSVGVVNQNGGTITVTQNLKMGSDTPNTGTNYGFYNLSGGSFTVTGVNRCRVGQAQGGPGSAELLYLSGSGGMNISGLILSLNDNANAGVDPGGNTVLYVAGGTITASAVNGSGGAAGLSLGIGGKGGHATNTVTISGTGSVSLLGGVGLGTSVSGIGATDAGRVAILNLNSGGFLQTLNIVLGAVQSPVGYLNLNGGTLKAQVSVGNYIAGLTRATVYRGGLTLDDNSASITVGQALLAPTGTGVSNIVVIGATGYTGALYVNISGGNPTAPATAVAEWDGSGTISTITVTDPGDGYTSTPTVTLLDGGGNAGTLTATLGTGTSASGGLTKTGVGTLTLSGANTYTGLTSVASGTLRLSGAKLGGSLTVSNGLTLGGSGASTISGSVTMGSGASVNLSNSVAATLIVSNGVTLNNNVLSLSLGGVTATNNIVVAGGSLAVSGLNTVNLSAAGGFGTVGNYRLITNGSLANTNVFLLGTMPSGPFGFTLAVIGGDLFVQVTSSLPGSAFWQGGVNSSWNNNGNWAPDAAGTNTISVPPGAPTTVEFATTNSPQNLTTTLGADFSINTLTFSTPNSVAVGGANALTNINGMVVGPSAGSVIISNSNLVLGFNQTWVNNGSNPFTVTAPIGGGANALTIGGNGTTVLKGASTYTGGTIVNGGTLQLGNPTATLASGGSLTINGGTVDISSNTDTIGAVTLTSGTITGTVGILTSSAVEVQSGAVSAKFGGAGGLTKTTSGTVTLTGSNTYTGSTFVKLGTLVVDTGGFINNTAFSDVGQNGADNGTMTLQGNASFTETADFNIGDQDASMGTLYISNNATVVTSRMFVGSAFNAGSAAQGVVNQVSGSVKVTGLGDPVFDLGGSMNLTGNKGSGTYNLSGGSVLVANAGNAWIGGWGKGALNVTGGAITFSNFLSVGRQFPTLIGEQEGGTLTVSGGSVIQANPLAHTVVGEAGTGTLVVASSGLMVVAGNDGLIIGNAATAMGTVNLNGGTLITTNVNRNLGGTNGAAIFNFNGGTLKANGPHSAFMTGLTTATVQSAGAVIDDSGFNIAIGQALLDGGGGGGLTKLGTGILTLTGTNTYSGPTAVTAGQLIAPATQTSIGAVTVADSAALRVNAANTSQWSPTSFTLGATTGATIEFNALSNTNVPPLNVGTYTLFGSDPLKIIGGAFITNNSYPLIHYGALAGTGTNTFKPPGGMTATLTTNNNTIFLNVINFGTQLWTGNVNSNWDIEITTNWIVNVTPTTYGDGGLVQFDDTASTTSVKILSDVVPAAVIISNFTKTYTFSGAAISGFGTLTKMGSGTAVMSNKNTYSGDTTVSSGTVRVGVDNAIPGGPGQGNVTLNSTLDLAGHSNTINGLSGSGIVDSTVAGAAVLTVGSDSSSSTFSGVVQNTAGTLALVKAGGGMFTLVSSNTHSGGTTLSAGQLNINNNGALGAAAGTFTINGGTIDVTTSTDITIANNNPQTWNGDFTYAGSVTNLNLGTGTVTIPNSVNRQVTVNSGTLTNGVILTNMLTVAGVINGGGSAVIKAGAGTLALLGVNNFTVSLTIANGTVAVTTIGDIFSPGGVGAGGLINFGGTGPTTGILRYTGTGETTFKQISFPNAGSGGIDMSGTGLLAFGNDLVVAGAGIHTLTLLGSGPGTGEVDGVISDYVNGTTTNATSVTKDGTNVWVLTANDNSGLNTYTGESYVRNGTLIVSSLANLGVGGTISFGGGNLPGTLLYTGSGDVGTRIINLRAGGSGGGVIDQSGTGLLQFGPVFDINAAGGQAHTLTLQGSTSGLGAIIGTISDNNNTSSVTKAGSGLWTLSGTNTYTGVTTINNGTLAISGGGAISNSPTITVSSGGTLDVSVHTGGGMTFVAGQTLAGSGTVKGATTIANGATLAPGVSSGTGTLTVNGNLVLNSSSTLAYGLGTNSDQTVVIGQLTLDGTINVTDAGGFGPGTYTIFNYLSVVNNTLNVGSLPGGFSGTVSNDTPNNRILLVVGSAADPFTTWQSHYFTGSPLNSSPNADPLGKGMSNTNQFLAGFNPTNPAAYLHIISTVKAGSDINVTYLGANGDTTYTGGPSSRTNVLEFTAGTVNGSYSSNNFASTGQTNILSGGTGLGLVTNMVDSGGATNNPSRYYRVRVLVP